jgi:hypothetical protein
MGCASTLNTFPLVHSFAVRRIGSLTAYFSADPVLTQRFDTSTILTSYFPTFLNFDSASLVFYPNLTTQHLLGTCIEHSHRRLRGVTLAKMLMAHVMFTVLVTDQFV